MNTKVKIYQIRRDLSNFGDLYTNNLAYLQRIIDFRHDLNQYYREMYDFEDNFEGMTKDEILDTIDNRFRFNLPDDFKGPALQISDIIGLDDELWFKDSYGYIQVGD